MQFYRPVYERSLPFGPADPLATDLGRMRSRYAIPPIVVSLTQNYITLQINDIGHIGICPLVTDVIAVDHIDNIFGGGIFIVMSIIINPSLQCPGRAYGSLHDKKERMAESPRRHSF